MSYLFAFSYCLWGSLSKNTGLVLPFLPPEDYILSELSTMTCPSWVALHSMSYTFIELCKSLHHDNTVICEGLTEEALQIADERREVKSKGERER